MDTVWLLHHVHEFYDGHEDAKLMGVFASELEAQSALEKVRNQPGFRDVPEGFCISKHTLGLLGWVEGYVTLEPGKGFV